MLFRRRRKPYSHAHLIIRPTEPVRDGYIDARGIGLSGRDRQVELGTSTGGVQVLGRTRVEREVDCDG